MKLGIITLQRQPPDPSNWIRYHVDVGITHFYVWLEDSDALKPELEMLAKQYSSPGKPVAVHVELGSVNRDKEDNYSDLMTRQQRFVNRMLEKSRKDGVDWVFHIDDDELLHPRKHKTWDTILSSLKPDCASVHLQNWEGYSPANPSGSWITDPGVKYMPQTCAHLFAAYTNGKGGSKTTPGQQMHGPHHFKGGKECEIPEDVGVVLHHDSLALSQNDVPPRQWIEKNLLRAHSDLSKIPFIAAKDSVHAVTQGSEAEKKATWEKYRSQVGSRFQECKHTQSLKLPSHDY